MYDKILSLLKSSAIRGQFLSDNRFHMLIVDDQFEQLASDIIATLATFIPSPREKVIYDCIFSEGSDEPIIAHV